MAAPAGYIQRRIGYWIKDSDNSGPYWLSQAGVMTLISAVPPVPAAPVFLTPPAINGSPLVGSQSSYTSGTYTGYPAPVVTQQWTYDGVDIPGATGLLSPVLTAGQESHLLRVRQILTNGSGTTNSTSASAVINRAAAVTSAPAIIGTPQEGVASAYTPGSVVGYPAPVTSQTWQIPPADVGTGATYTPSVGEAGDSLQVRQTATNAFGSGSQTSPALTILPESTGGILANSPQIWFYEGTGGGGGPGATPSLTGTITASALAAPVTGVYTADAHTVASGVDALLMRAGWSNGGLDARDVSAPTWNGVAAELIANTKRTDQNADGTWQGTAWFVLLAPAAGTFQALMGCSTDSMEVTLELSNWNDVTAAVNGDDSSSPVFDATPDQAVTNPSGSMAIASVSVVDYMNDLAVTGGGTAMGTKRTSGFSGVSYLSQYRNAVDPTLGWSLTSGGPGGNSQSGFSLTGTGGGSGGEAYLEWNPPTQLANGDPIALDPVINYMIYWEDTAAPGVVYDEMVSGAIDDYTVTGLAPGDYEFWMTSINSAGESFPPSPRVEVTIPA